MGRGYACVTGVYGVMESRGDPLGDILNRVFLSVPDGMPMVWVGRLQGHRAMRRVYRPDYMGAMCEHSLFRGYRHFLDGAAPGVTERLKARLEFALPRIAIVGT